TRAGRSSASTSNGIRSFGQVHGTGQQTLRRSFGVKAVIIPTRPFDLLHSLRTGADGEGPHNCNARKLGSNALAPSLKCCRTISCVISAFMRGPSLRLG